MDPDIDIEEEEEERTLRDHLVRARNIHKQLREFTNEVKDIFKDNNEEMPGEDLALLIKNPPKQPAFPDVILTMALVKDGIDIGDVTVLGIVGTTVLSFVITIVLLFWFRGKMKGRWWKKVIIKKLWVWILGALIIEYIPFLKIIPTTTILVLMAYYREKKIVRLFNLLLEKARDFEIPVRQVGGSGEDAA
jgi:hypothetical protein